MMSDLGLAIWREMFTREDAWGAGHGGDRGWGAVVSALEVWHTAEGTRNAEEVAWRQGYVAYLISCGRTQADVAERLGVSLRRVERDVQVLKRVYGVRARRVRPSEPVRGPRVRDTPFEGVVA